MKPHGSMRWAVSGLLPQSLAHAGSQLCDLPEAEVESQALPFPE